MTEEYTLCDHCMVFGGQLCCHCQVSSHCTVFLNFLRVRSSVCDTRVFSQNGCLDRLDFFGVGVTVGHAHKPDVVLGGQPYRRR